MNFLLDQDVYAITASFLRDLGHNVITAADLGLSQAKDTELLACAHKDERIFVTRDKDFGGLVFVERLGSGVIFLRMTPGTMGSVHQELARVLGLYSTEELATAFVVIEPGVHRIRRIT